MPDNEELDPINFDKLAAFRPKQPAAATAGADTSLLGYPTYHAPAPLAEPDYYQAPLDRPAGVTIIGALNLIAAALLLLVLVRADGDEIGSAFSLIVQIGIGLFAGVGLLMLQRWAYWLAIVGYALSLSINLIANFREQIYGATLISIAIPALILFYLAQKDVREAFVD